MNGLPRDQVNTAKSLQDIILSTPPNINLIKHANNYVKCR